VRIAFFLLLLGACTERALDAHDGSLDGGADARMCGTARVCTGGATHSQFALDAVCVMPGGDLEITGKPLSLGFCHCLHGCGPGIDGAIELLVANHSTSAKKLELAGVLYARNEITYEDAGGTSPGLRRMYTCPGGPSFWDGKIASGTTERVVIPQHFDVIGEPSAGDYRLRVQLSVDGELRWFELGTITMPADPHCG
jgi:hypothetical protein